MVGEPSMGQMIPWYQREITAGRCLWMMVPPHGVWRIQEVSWWRMIFSESRYPLFGIMR